MEKKWAWVVGVIIGVLIVLIGLGPIVVTHIMRKVTMAKRDAAEEARKRIRRPILLKVRGRVVLVEDVDTTWLILESDSGKRYILIGAKAEELKDRLGERVEVIGKIKHPRPKEINGKPIRFIIDVMKIEPE